MVGLVAMPLVGALQVSRGCHIKRAARREPVVWQHTTRCSAAGGTPAHHGGQGKPPLGREAKAEGVHRPKTTKSPAASPSRSSARKGEKTWSRRASCRRTCPWKRLSAGGAVEKESCSRRRRRSPPLYYGRARPAPRTVTKCAERRRAQGGRAAAVAADAVIKGGLSRAQRLRDAVDVKAAGAGISEPLRAVSE